MATALAGRQTAAAAKLTCEIFAPPTRRKGLMYIKSLFPQYFLQYLKPEALTHTQAPTHAHTITLCLEDYIHKSQALPCYMKLNVFFLFVFL